MVKSVDAINIKGHYYISLHEIETNEVVLELSIAMHEENTALKEEIAVLKKRLSILEGTSNTNLNILK